MLYINKIEFLPIDKVKSNNWNSNQLTEKEFQKLVDDIKTNGFIGAIIVRKNGNEYEIIDGEHRWRALKELGEKQIPCIIKQEKDDKAKINSIRWNTERGQQNQKKLAQIIKSLEQKHGYSLQNIEHELVYSLPELQDKLALLDLPEDFDEIIKEARDKELQELPVLYTFIVPQRYKKIIDETFDKFKGHKGEVLGTICQQISQK